MRRGLTLAWMLALAASFHWWDVTLRFPRLLVWTEAFLALFLATAFVLFGRGLRARRREVWLPAPGWGAPARRAGLATPGVPAGSVGERHYARPQALARAVAYLQGALARLGYEVSVQPFTAGGQTFHNLEVVIPGGSRAEEIVVVGGHYDTVEGSPGADDNGSGSAAVVVLAGALAPRRPTHTP